MPATIATAIMIPAVSGVDDNKFAPSSLGMNGCDNRGKDSRAVK